MNHNLPPTSQQLSDDIDALSRDAFARRQGLPQDIEVRRPLPMHANLVGDVIPREDVAGIESREMHEANSTHDMPDWKTEASIGALANGARSLTDNPRSDWSLIRPPADGERLPESLFDTKDKTYLKSLERGIQNLADQPAPTPVERVPAAEPPAEEQRVA